MSMSLHYPLLNHFSCEDCWDILGKHSMGIRIGFMTLACLSFQPLDYNMLQQWFLTSLEISPLVFHHQPVLKHRQGTTTPASPPKVESPKKMGSSLNFVKFPLEEWHIFSGFLLILGDAMDDFKMEPRFTVGRWFSSCIPTAIFGCFQP